MVKRAIMTQDELYTILRGRIMTGYYGKGRMPGQHEMAREFGVSRSMIVLILRRLQSRDLVSPAPGGSEMSFYPAYPVLKLNGLTKNFADDLRASGFEPVENNLIDPEVVQEHSEFPGAVLHRKRAQGILHHKMLRVAENYYDVVSPELLNLIRDPALDALEYIQEHHNRIVVRSVDSLSGRLAEQDEWRDLALGANNPVVELRRSCYDQQDRLLLYSVVTCNANHFIFSYDYRVNHWSSEK